MNFGCAAHQGRMAMKDSMKYRYHLFLVTHMKAGTGVEKSQMYRMTNKAMMRC